MAVKSPSTGRVARTGKKLKADAQAGQPTAAGKRRLRQIENKRNAILNASLQLFSQFGVHGTSLDQVANLADVSKTNLLYYFSSKEELYKGVLLRILDVWVNPLEHFTVDKEPVQAISDYVRAKLEVSRDFPQESRLFCMEVMQGAPLMLGELQHPLKETVERKVDVINSWIAAGKLVDVEPHHLIFSIWATTQHYADFNTQVEALTNKTLKDAAFFEGACNTICGILLNGITPRR